MKLSSLSGNINQIKTDLLVIAVYKEKLVAPELKSIDKILNNKISRALTSKEFIADKGKTIYFDGDGKLKAKRVVLVGLGEKGNYTNDIARLAAYAAVKVARSLKAQDLVFKAFNDNNYELFEGAFLGEYEFKGMHKKINGNNKQLESFSILVKTEKEKTGANKLAKKALVVQNAVKLAKDMVNLPSNIVTPSYIAKEAQNLAKTTAKVSCKVIGFEEAKKLGMGGFCAVAQGANNYQPAKVVILKYVGGGKEKIGLVGKGITFDSGGISIKQSNGMKEMKTDMGGAATVLGAFKALAELKAKINITAIIATTENMPGGHSYKPGDIITHMNGKTTEIDSTDAEGRMVLSDALCYIQKEGVKKIIDYATLTGACLISLGEIRSGFMTNNQKFGDSYIKVSEKTGEKVWQLPLDEEYDDLLKSDVADSLNNTTKKQAGTVTGGKFLQKFIEKGTEWIHIDIAGTAYLSTNTRYLDKNATGHGIRTLVELFS